MHEKQTTKVYLSLIPIILGVAIATVTEINFDIIGLGAALAATMGFSLQHIFSKKVLHDTNVHHLRLLYILGRIALVMFLPFWLFMDVRNVLSDNQAMTKLGTTRVISLLWLDGLLNFLQNIIAFSVLSYVTPLTYAVANASKRIFVIAVSLLTLGNPVTGANIFGMMLAIFGVLFYNKAKYDAKRKQTVLPYVNVNSTNNTSGYVPLLGNGYANNNNKQKNLLFH